MTNPATTRNIVRLATDQNVPTNGVGGMAQWTKAIGASQRVQRRASTGDGSTATARRTRTSPTVPTVDRPASRRRRRCRCSASRRHAAEPRRVRAGHLHADRQARAHAERARRSLAQLRRPQSGDDGGDRPADGQQPAVDSRTATTPSSARTSARSITSSDRVSVWGAANSGFRAPTLTELYRQFSVGAVTTRPERPSWARAPGRRRGWASTSRRRAT